MKHSIKIGLVASLLLSASLAFAGTYTSPGTVLLTRPTTQLAPDATNQAILVANGYPATTPKTAGVNPCTVPGTWTYYKVVPIQPINLGRASLIVYQQTCQ